MSEADKICHPRLIDTEFLDAIPQLAKGQAEKFRGGRLVVTRLLQRVDDCLSLHVFDLISEVGCGRGSRQLNSGHIEGNPVRDGADSVMTSSPIRTRRVARPSRRDRRVRYAGNEARSGRPRRAT